MLGKSPCLAVNLYFVDNDTIHHLTYFWLAYHTCALIGLLIRELLALHVSPPDVGVLDLTHATHHDFNHS